MASDLRVDSRAFWGSRNVSILRRLWRPLQAGYKTWIH